MGIGSDRWIERDGDNEPAPAPKPKRSKWEQVGSVDVDAGLVWLGDPCYILHKDAENKPKDIGKDWHDFCHKIDHDSGATVFKHDPGHDGLGVCVSTAHGDGRYPVLVRRDKDGRILEIRIKFG